MTFVEHVKKLRALKRRLAIWEAMHRLMDDKFISKDGSTKVSGIREADTGEIVPEAEIEDVLKEIAEGSISELQAEIRVMESAEILFESKVKA